jgi:hypothetical protein
MAQRDVVRLLTKHKELTAKQMSSMLRISSVSSNLKKMTEYREIVYVLKPTGTGSMVRHYRLV